mmetsp:Transcript_9753/g.22775  ORF Transcript_9753/g.22775 Transcript_9753/m.22775 type:complete len:241 (-) Transcript_9753:723-1445(-)
MLLDETLKVDDPSPKSRHCRAHPCVGDDIHEKGLYSVNCAFIDSLPGSFRPLRHRALEPEHHMLVRHIIPDLVTPPIPLNNAHSNLELEPPHVDRQPHLLTCPRGVDGHQPLALSLQAPQIAGVLILQPLLCLFVPLQEGRTNVVAPLHLNCPHLLHDSLHRLHLQHALPDRLGSLDARVRHVQHPPVCPHKVVPRGGQLLPWMPDRINNARCGVLELPEVPLHAPDLALPLFPTNVREP